MSQVLPLKPTPDDMARHINSIAKDSANIVITKHAKERMAERRITRRHVVTCLRKGCVSEWPYKDIHNCWRCTMVRAVSGVDVTVAIAVNFENQVIVVTVF